MELTVREAIKQGYTMYGFASRDWQYLNELHDDVFSEVEEHEHKDLVLAEKNPNYPTISAETIAERLADQVADSYNMICNSDDDAVYNTVAEIDYSAIATKINKELEQHKYWMLTDIKLTK